MGRRVRNRYKLRYSILVLNERRLVAAIVQQHDDLATVVGVDEAGRVRHEHTALRQPATAPDCYAVAGRRLDGDAGRNCLRVARTDYRGVGTTLDG